MAQTRREFGRMALVGVPATMLAETSFLGSVLAQAKPNSKFGGVQIGVITYSYRTMPDQSAQATLQYVQDSGISAVELMDGPVEHYLGRPARPGGAGGFGGGPPAAGRRGADDPAGRQTPYDQLLAGTMPSCEPKASTAPAPGAGPGPGRGPLTAEQQEAQRAYQEQLRQWRSSVSMEKVREVRKRYNDAGVSIYAYKPDGVRKDLEATDAELDYAFSVAAALGASHVTMELPAGPSAVPIMNRLVQFAEKHKVAVAYHNHLQGSMTAFDEALALSKWNMLNVDLGHHVAAGNVGGTPLDFLNRHHARIASFHLKDRTLPQHCALTVPFGKGDGQLKETLLAIKKNQWTFPASIELEYPIPADSDAVKETKKCVDYARSVLA